MVLVLCIDRDDDIGRKTGIKGPIVGEKANKNAATKLLLKDPEDSDANAIFAAIKTHKETKGSEVVTITGNVKVGPKSDQRIASQLQSVIKKTGQKKIIFVTDGAEDEYIIPLLQNKGEIVSIKRVVVRQSEKLEGMYYVVKNFIEDRKMARFVFGVPAVILLLISIFGIDGWRVVLGGIGAYLIIKGFGIDDILANFYSELVALIKRGHVAALFYIVSGLFIIIGFLWGYMRVEYIPIKQFERIFLIFMSHALFPWFISAFFFWFGRAILHISNKTNLKHYITYLSLIFAVTIIVKSAVSMLLAPERGYFMFLASIIIGIAVVGIFVLIEKKL